MANNSDAVRVGGATQIYFAPVGTAFPTWVTDIAADPLWIDVGYVTTEGVTWKFSRETKDIDAMQASDPIRVVSTKMPKTFGFSVMQAGQEQFALALGGGTWAQEGATSGVMRYEPPDLSEVIERAAVIEMIDGTNKYRWNITKCQNKEGVEFKYTKEDAAAMPITMTILAPSDGGVPFYLDTDDPACADVLPLTARGNGDVSNGDVSNGDDGEPQAKSGRREPATAK